MIPTNPRVCIRGGALRATLGTAAPELSALPTVRYRSDKPQSAAGFSSVVSCGNLLWILKRGHIPGDRQAHTVHLLDERRGQPAHTGARLGKVLQRCVCPGDPKTSQATNEILERRFS